MRPHSLDEYVGQKHIVGEGAVLRKMIDASKDNEKSRDGEAEKILFCPMEKNIMKSLQIYILVFTFAPQLHKG